VTTKESLMKSSSATPMVNHQSTLSLVTLLSSKTTTLPLLASRMSSFPSTSPNCTKNLRSRIGSTTTIASMSNSLQARKTTVSSFSKSFGRSPKALQDSSSNNYSRYLHLMFRLSNLNQGTLPSSNSRILPTPISWNFQYIPSSNTKTTIMHHWRHNPQ